jgi:hypothetical protein
MACATAGQTTKLLSFAVFFMRRSAIGTGSGSVGRINSHKTNTVLLSFVFDPVEHPPVCPRRHSFTKRFASALLFATLHIVKVFDAKRVDGAPRQLIDSPIDQIFALSEGSLSAFASRLTAFDLVSDLFEPLAVMVPFGIREQIVDADVNGQNLAINFHFSVRNFNPQDKAILVESASSNELGGRPRNPLIENGGALCRDSQPLALIENRQFDDQIEAVTPFFNYYKLGVQHSRAFEDRAGCGNPQFLRRFLCSNDDLNGLLQRLTFISLREPRLFQSLKCRFVQLAWILPKAMYVEVNRRSIGFK